MRMDGPAIFKLLGVSVSRRARESHRQTVATGCSLSSKSSFTGCAEVDLVTETETETETEVEASAGDSEVASG